MRLWRFKNWEHMHRAYRIKVFLVATLAFVFFVFPARAATIDELVRLIASLQVEVVRLQAELATLRASGAGAPRAASAVPRVKTQVFGGAVFYTFPRPAYDATLIGQQIAEGIVAERRAAGLSALSWNGGVAEAAQAHTDEQTRDNLTITPQDKPCAYPFIHHEGRTFGLHLSDRLKNAQVPFRIAGENIIILPLETQSAYQVAGGVSDDACPKVARDLVPPDLSQTEADRFIADVIAEREAVLRTIPSVAWLGQSWQPQSEIAARAVREWMNSPGHRANILNSRFMESGIGVGFVNDFVVVTQNFIGR